MIDPNGPQNPARALPTLPPSEWLRPTDRVAIVAHGKWGLWSAKTGVQVLRFSRARTLGVIDRDRVGQDAAHLVDMPHKGPLPIYESLDVLLKACDEPPTRVVVGVAPIGDVVPAAARRDVETAIENRIPVIAGMHRFLADDPGLRRLALEYDTPLVDARRPPATQRVATGAGRLVPVPVVTTVGSDCNTGKMTTSVLLRDAAHEAGIRAAFVATGQTGLLLEPSAGAPIDRMISDFAAGEVERQLLLAARLDDHGEATDETPDLIIVEGQGALSHPAYAGVAAAILHGSWPDCLVLCHPHGRREKYFPTEGPPFPLLPPLQEIGIIESFLAPVWPARVAAIALSAPRLTPDEYVRERDRMEKETGHVVSDGVREGGGRLLEAVLQSLKDDGLRASKRPVASRSVSV